MRHLLATAAVTVLALACADAPSREESAPDADATTATAPTLPPAIVGEGGPLEGTDLHYVADDTLTTGYLAVPAGEGPFPALVIIHEWNGLQDRVRQLADDFAAEGYVTLAADLFQGRTGANPQENIALVQEAQGNPAAMIANLDTAVAFLKNRSDVTGRVGAMGWCFGGGVALSFGLDGVNHGFWLRVDGDPEVRTAPATDAWQRLKAYLARTLR